MVLRAAAGRLGASTSDLSICAAKEIARNTYMSNGIGGGVQVSRSSTVKGEGTWHSRMWSLDSTFTPTPYRSPSIKYTTTDNLLIPTS